jgi:hypothetical protein
VVAGISQVPFVDRSRAPHPPDILEQMLEVAGPRRLPARCRAAMINQPGGEVGWRRLVALDDQSR